MGVGAYDRGGGPVNADDESLSAREARLLRALGQALGPDPLPDGLVERVEQLRVLKDLDSALVKLTDQATAQLVGMRGETGHARLEFMTDDGSVALELVPEPDRLVGQILAGDLTEVALESRTGVRATAVVDQLGRFTIEHVVAGPARLRLVGGATTPVTDWFLL
jgi:hypothetical protein